MATVKTSELSGAALNYAVAQCEGECLAPQYWHLYDYSSNWSWAGPIIEREEISIEFGRAEFKNEWIAYKLGLPYEDNPEGGHTPLVAAMRCFVASKTGDNVEIPDSLIDSLIFKE